MAIFITFSQRSLDLHLMVYLLRVYLCVKHHLFIYFFLPGADTLTFMQLRQEKGLQGHAQISRAMSREYKMCSRALTVFWMCVSLCSRVTLVWPWYFLFLVFSVSLSHTNTVTHSVTTSFLLLKWILGTGAVKSQAGHNSLKAASMWLMQYILSLL